jgi:hypothetical protein
VISNAVAFDAAQKASGASFVEDPEINPIACNANLRYDCDTSSS